MAFVYFSRLPIELRQEVYLLATPPRIVHVRERTEKDYEVFKDEFCSTPANTRLHPDLANFAFKWRSRIPAQCRQRTLDDYGFTGARAPQRPWTPSPSTPEIPPQWLGDHPEIAWEFARQGYLYSSAPIPPLLHACPDSRAVLIRNGYDLAFRTRSSPPRTWFNFKRDLLFLEECTGRDDGLHELLSCRYWDYGQFHTDDMKRVQRLVLGRWAFDSVQPDPGQNQYLVKQLTSMLRLFSGVQDLLLVEWSRRDLESWSEFEPGNLASPRHVCRKTYLKPFMPGLWGLVAISEIDAVLGFFTKSAWRSVLSPAGYAGRFLKAHQEEFGGQSRLFQHLQSDMESRLAVERGRLAPAHVAGRPVAWQIPHITFVHVLPEPMMELLLQERGKTLNRLLSLQHEWKTLSSGLTREQGLTREDMDQVDQFKVQMAEFANAYWPEIPDHDCDYCHGGCYYDSLENSLREWWIKKASLQTPAHWSLGEYYS